MRDQQALDRYVRDRMPAWIEELREFCAIESEEQETAAIGEAAEWTRARLARLGASVETVSIDGVAPLVVGSIGTGRTLLAVQHYDVQPGVPLELWTTGPYDPHVREGRMYARGATDNKGEFLSRVWGVEAYLATFGSLPCRIRFLVEGEEEHGSPNLGRLLDLGTDLRLADGALAEGGGVDSEGRPVIVGGGRGMLLIELIARTIAYDAHSAGAMLLPNAAVRLVQALATLWRPDGLPALDVITGTTPPTTAQLALLESAPMDWQDHLRDEFGIDAFLAGRTGMEAVIASTFETTVNLQSMWAGFTGPGSKTIVPAEAHARIDIRLVPDQDPDAILGAVRAHLDEAGFGDISIEPIVTPARAWWTPSDHPILAAAKRASSAVFGVPSEQEVAMSGTIPMYEVCARHNVPLTSLGAGHDDCRAHAPDENYRLDYAEQAARTMARFIDEFAAIGDA